jgi:hypothetical protein
MKVPRRMSRIRSWTASLSAAQRRCESQLTGIYDFIADAKLTDLLPALVLDCPKRGSVSVYGRCKAVFERRG